MARKRSTRAADSACSAAGVGRPVTFEPVEKRHWNKVKARLELDHFKS